jgi:endoglucanase
MFRFFLNPFARFTHLTITFMLRMFHRLGAFQQRQRRNNLNGRLRNNIAVPPLNNQGTKSRFSYASRVKQKGFRSYSRILGLGLVFVLLALAGVTLPSQNPVDAANGAMIQLPLSTKGSKIVDSTGRSVFLRGVNWFGIETEVHAPHGLWKRDYKEMLAQIKSLGYNVIRLPYAVQSLRASNVSGIDFSIGSNQELQGKSPLEVMDAIIQEAERQGLLILLDSHRLNDQRIPELWYGDGFTEADWIDTWKMLATRYRNQANIIGADLKNEPHGRASWGTNDPATDWRLAAERCGNAIQAINPNWLIVVEGVENNVPGQKLKIHWMGANLEGVERNPVRLSRPNKVVYSPHEYGSGVYNQPWFSESAFPSNLPNRWETGWNYIATKGIAPVFIGEFGGRQVDNNSKEGIWQRKLVDYIRQKDLSFSYWSWNPDSEDTGGILQNDWLSVDAAKQELLQGLVAANSFIQNTASSAIIPTNPYPQPNSNPVIINPTSTTQPNSNPVIINPTPTTQPNSNPVIINPTSTTQPNSNPAIINPPPSTQPKSSTTVITNTQSRLKVLSNMQSDWQSGFCMSMQVSNQGNSSIRDWQVTFQMDQAAINNSWNGNFKPQGSQYVVTPMDWGQVIEPGQSRDLGFCANKLGSNYQPRQISVSLR